MRGSLPPKPYDEESVPQFQPGLVKQGHQRRADTANAGFVRTYMELLGDVAPQRTKQGLAVQEAVISPSGALRARGAPQRWEAVSVRRALP